MNFSAKNPPHRQAENRCVQSPKKFGWKFWILILQKSEKFGAEIWQKLFWKIFFSKQNRKNKRLKNLQLKIFKLKKFVVYHWEKPNKTIWKATENIFLKMKFEKFWHFNPEILTNFLENIWKNCWKMENCAAHNN